jgi:hypothetical protein
MASDWNADDVLADLIRRPPLRPISPGNWYDIIDGVRHFADRWHRPAMAAGWTEGQLYGLDREAPYTRLDAMGAAWLVASRRDQVVSIGPDAITLKTRSCAMLRLFRR